MPMNPNLPIERPPLTKGGREAQEVIRTVRQLSQQRARAEPKDTAPGVRPRVVFGQTVPGEVPAIPPAVPPSTIPSGPDIARSIITPGSLPGIFGNILARGLSGDRAPLFSILTCRGLTGKRRRECLKNIAKNVALNILTAGLSRLPIRIPKGQVQFVLPSLKPQIFTRPGVKPGRIPVRPRVQPAKPVPPAVLPGKTPKPGGPFRRDRPLPRQKPPPKPPAPKVFQPTLPVFVDEIGDFPGAAVRVTPGPAPKISPEIRDFPKTEPRTAAESAVLPRAGAKVSPTTAAATGRASSRLPGTAGGSLLPFLFRSAATSLLASVSPGTATQLQGAALTPLVPVTVATLPPPAIRAARSGPARRGRECQEVKRRKRKRGKCREGFFKEMPGRTRYTTWRTVNCVTGKTIEEFK